MIFCLIGVLFMDWFYWLIQTAYHFYLRRFQLHTKLVRRKRANQCFFFSRSTLKWANKPCSSQAWIEANWNENFASASVRLLNREVEMRYLLHRSWWYVPFSIKFKTSIGQRRMETFQEYHGINNKRKFCMEEIYSPQNIINLPLAIETDRSVKFQFGKRLMFRRFYTHDSLIFCRHQKASPSCSVLNAFSFTLCLSFRWNAQSIIFLHSFCLNGSTEWDEWI